MFFHKRKKKGNKKIQLIVVVLIVFITILLKAQTYLWPSAEVLISDKKINVLVADTDEHRYKGLGMRDDMGELDGMAFVFKNYSQHTIVMRDMNFPIDIVWAVGVNDEGKKCKLNKFGFRKMITGLYHSCVAEVIDIAPNVKPQNDMLESNLIPYFSTERSTIVFELKAGWVKENSLKIGDTIEILD